MAEWTVLKFKIVEFTVQSLVFTCLALVEVLCENGLTTGYAWREVTSTFLTVYVTIFMLETPTLTIP